ncbi:putative serine protease 47 isoform X1 [Camelus ferus]|uniref:Serine protease 47 isoform X1 n=1 Tax=Camelus ferus TaxID=419612 RepID=A0A8B8UGQ9_CAMFR|nr:putative serine protease 47 isoform X1 [Camelus ferus]
MSEAPPHQLLLAGCCCPLLSQGDSGGPLVCDLTDAWVLVGLASWGLDCRHPIYPSIFTNVSYFIDWMDEIQRLTPLPDAMSACPQTQFPHQSLQAAGSPGPSTGFVPSQTCSLLLFLLQAPWQALW